MIVGNENASNSRGFICILEPIANSANASLNEIEIDTLLKKDSYYELVYNEAQNKFICEEVRNAN